MKNLSPAMRAWYASGAPNATTCWRAVLQNGRVIAGTKLDQDLPIDGVVYQTVAGYLDSDVESSSELNPDNLEIEGFLASPAITEADIHSGAWDYAYVEMFETCYTDTSIGKNILRSGTLGEVKGGRIKFTAELRGLMQAYTNTVVRLMTKDCNADFGDARCKVNISSYTATGTVQGTYTTNSVIYDASRTEPGADGAKAITGISRAENAVVTCPGHGFAQNTTVQMTNIVGCILAGATKDGVFYAGSGDGLNGMLFQIVVIDGDHFSIPIDTRAYNSNAAQGVTNPLQVYSPYVSGGMAHPANASGYFDHGKVTFTSGANAGLSMEVKAYSPGFLSLMLPMPFAIAVGDTYTVTTGCNQSFENCVKYNNVVNFRGFQNLPQSKIYRRGSEGVATSGGVSGGSNGGGTGGSGGTGGTGGGTVTAGGGVTSVSTGGGSVSTAGTTQAVPTGIANGATVILNRNTVYQGPLDLSGKTGVTVVAAAGTGAVPVISAGKAVTGWTVHSGSIYKAAVDFVPAQLSLNDVPVKQASWPATVPAWATSTAGMQSTDVTGATLYQKNTKYTIVTSVLASNTVDTTYPFYLEGKLWMLTGANAWAYDSGFLYVWAPDGASPEGRAWAAPAQDAINADNSSGVVIDGINVISARNGVSGAGSTNLTVKNSTLKNLSKDGVFANGSTGATADNLIVTNARGVGVNGYHGSSNFTAKNNTVTNAGMVGNPSPSEGGIYVGPSSGSVITNNTVTNSGYSGINATGNSNAIISNNTVDGFCKTMTDGGGIYVNQTSRIPSLSTTINGNRVSNGLGQQVMGIYLDDGSNGVTVTGNSLDNNDTGVMLHDSFNNTIQGNTFVKSASQHVMFANSGGATTYGNILKSNTMALNNGEYAYNLSYGSNFQGWASWSSNTYISNSSKFAHTYDGASANVEYTYQSWAALAGEIGSTMNAAGSGGGGSTGNSAGTLTGYIMPNSTETTFQGELTSTPSSGGSYFAADLTNPPGVKILGFYNSNGPRGLYVGPAISQPSRVTATTRNITKDELITYLNALTNMSYGGAVTTPPRTDTSLQDTIPTTVQIEGYSLDYLFSIKHGYTTTTGRKRVWHANAQKYTDIMFDWSPTKRMLAGLGGIVSYDGKTWEQKPFTIVSPEPTFQSDNRYVIFFMWSVQANKFIYYTLPTLGGGGGYFMGFYVPYNTMVSDDGYTWTEHIGAPGVNWKYILQVPDKGITVGLAQNTSGISHDGGLSWDLTPVHYSPGALIQDLQIAFSPELNLFVAVFQSLDYHSVLTSPDGINWTLGNTPPGFWGNVSWVSEVGLFIAGGTSIRLAQPYTDNPPFGYSIMTSPDGFNWTPVKDVPHYPASMSGATWYPELGMVAMRGTTIHWGDGYTYPQFRMYSADGLNWTKMVPCEDNAKYIPDLGLFVGPSGWGDSTFEPETTYYWPWYNRDIRYSAA